MSRSESSIPHFEVTQDNLALSHIKTEPEVPTDEHEDQEWSCLDEKFSIKREVDIYEEKCDVVDHDFKEGLFNEEFNLGNVKFEDNSNANDATNITNIKDIKDVTKKESSSALKQEDSGNSPGDEIHSVIDDSQKFKLITSANRRRKLYQCTICSYTSQAPSGVKTHFNQIHSEVRSFRCTYCGYAAKLKYSLHKHMLSKHEKRSQTRYICHTCDKEFLTKANLKSHIHIHFGIKEKCPECRFKANQYLLKRHILLVHHPENLYRCRNCEFATPSKPNLRCHILKEHLNYHGCPCDICADFKSNSISEPFKCKFCPFTSKQKSCLSDHVKEHKYKDKTGKVRRLMVCRTCQRGFTKKSTLTRHINKMHSNIKESKHEDKF